MLMNINTSRKHRGTKLDRWGVWHTSELQCVIHRKPLLHLSFMFDLLHPGRLSIFLESWVYNELSGDLLRCLGFH